MNNLVKNTQEKEDPKKLQKTKSIVSELNTLKDVSHPIALTFQT